MGKYTLLYVCVCVAIEQLQLFSKTFSEKKAFKCNKTIQFHSNSLRIFYLVQFSVGPMLSLSLFLCIHTFECINSVDFDLVFLSLHTYMGFFFYCHANQLFPFNFETNIFLFHGSSLIFRFAKSMNALCLTKNPLKFLSFHSFVPSFTLCGMIRSFALEIIIIMTITINKPYAFICMNAPVHVYNLLCVCVRVFAFKQKNPLRYRFLRRARARARAHSIQ